MGEVVKAPLFCSQRLVLAFLAFIGNVLIYTTRVNISVAIICMVRNTPLNVTSANLSHVTSGNVTDDVCGGDSDMGVDKNTNDRAEFDWSKSTRSELLSMYFYGYIFTQIPSGWLASRYGGKRVWGVAMFFCALCTLLTPVSARTHVYLVYAIRFILGFAAGVTFPCVHAMLGKWTPPFERSKMASYTFAGPLVGNIATFSISGLLCQYGFDNGWGSIFYLSGLFNMLWVVLWFLFTADTPAKHRFITEREKFYIEASIGRGDVKKVKRVPWLQMFTSGPLWAAIIAHTCNNYVNYTLLTSLPLFMKESLNFDIKQNGLLSALPYVCQFVSSIAGGYAADTFREKGWMSTRTVRRSFQFTSFVGTAICIASVGQMSCEHRHIAVALLCLCTTFMGLNRSGYVVNHLDLAPSYAGILFGITNTFSTVPGMVAPIIAGALTPNKSPEEWKNVFYVCAATASAGAIIYLILADGELQKWAVPPETKISLEILAEHPRELCRLPADQHADTDHSIESAKSERNSPSVIPLVQNSTGVVV
ncbi:sialin-like isoform X2 [Physella acuta]|uniref:sialin-like isoform X1 n=1 Tax=Physella acuta TaxID=109671 RepID=UPI0027DAE824|nr:sialin-like isoform X1 [Physella acuta]XP_059140303.1 sialin-like isoform X2 [Physella acuta]